MAPGWEWPGLTVVSADMGRPEPGCGIEMTAGKLWCEVESVLLPSGPLITVSEFGLMMRGAGSIWKTLGPPPHVPPDAAVWALTAGDIDDPCSGQHINTYT